MRRRLALQRHLGRRELGLSGAVGLQGRRRLGQGGARVDAKLGEAILVPLERERALQKLR